MRLTLRTLLAYLDDTLEPSEIKQIGQKVAESDAAQELVARIKQVTRKRRLTTPPLTGPGAKFDPNLISEYLDNELSGEQVAEIEKICLESDVHLAEIAACHQILTLVLGEPALVPPTARERMYGLVKGREAIPFRKASAKSNPNLALKPGEEAEDTAVLGMPVHKHHASWLKWAIPIAGVFLLLALGAALVSGLWDGSGNRSKVANADKVAPGKDDLAKDRDKVADKDKATDKDKAGGDKVADKDKSADKDKGTDKDKASDKDKDKDRDPKPPDPPVTLPDRVPPPSKERKEIATYEAPRTGAPSILVSRPLGKDAWAHVEPNRPVYSTDSLVSLPGYASELRTKNDVRLTLWGTLPEFNPGNLFLPFMFESAVTLLTNSEPGVDLEFVLERGRVYVANRKDTPAVVRVRFDKEVWDVTLQERDSEVALELIKRYTPDINYQDGEDPRADLSLYVLKGRAGLRFGYHNFPNLEGPTGAALFVWDNKGNPPQQPITVKEPIALFGRELAATAPAAKDLRPALGEIADRMTGKQSVDVFLVEGAKTSSRPEQRALCIFCLGSIDDVSSLLDILGNNEDLQAAREREAAIFALRRWLSHGPETTKVLYVPKKGDQPAGGVLVKKNYKSTEAETVVALLHDFNPVDRRRKETFDLLVGYLAHSKLAVRELAFFHLKSLSIGVKELPNYDPTWGPDRRNDSVKAWKELINAGKLPPPPPPPMPGGPPTGPPK